MNPQLIYQEEEIAVSKEHSLSFDPSTSKKVERLPVLVSGLLVSRLSLKIARTFSVLVAMFLGAASVAHAQSTVVQDQPSLVIQSRGEAGYSTQGGGFDSFVYLDSFVPFIQTPGSDIWYVQSRLRLDSDANSGGSALVGYRQYTPHNDSVWGGYVGYDGRHTNASYFNQLSAGIEYLGDVEVRLNGYLPVGNVRRLASSSSETATTTVPDSAAFSGNSLLLTRGGEVTTTTSTELFEAAVGGLDLEVGTRLLSWEGGDLRSYAGIYYQDPAGRAGSIGARGRLTAQIGQRLNMGLSLSSDPLFDTQVMFQIGSSFGGTPQRSANDDSNIGYLGSSAQRQSNLVVNTQEEINVSTTALPAEEAVNPATGIPYRFVFVTGGASGTGTAENPYAQVTQGVADADSNGVGLGRNDIVYVQAGTNPGLDGFVVPDDVQVLSSGIAQALDTTIGPIVLPDSGGAERPLINQAPSGRLTVEGETNSMVALESDSTLSGFKIEGGDNVGVLIENVSDVNILDNVISSTGENADGVRIETTDVSISDITVSDGNVISTSGEGANAVTIVSRLEGIFDVTVSGNDLSTEAATTLSVFAQGPASISDITISNNSISASLNRSGNGVFVGGDGGELNNIAILQNEISTTGDGVNGIDILSIIGIDNISVEENNISTTGNESNGIGFGSLSGETSNFSVTGNNVSTTGEMSNGIDLGNATISTVRIVNNTILTDGIDADGIALAPNVGRISEAIIIDNNIVQAGRHSVSITFDPSITSCIAEFSRNVSSAPGTATAGNDLDISTSSSADGFLRLDFVGFNNIESNNVGFDNIAGPTSRQPESCR